MLVFYVVGILLTINIFLLNFYSIKSFYYWLYKKIIKPKFKLDEYVFINNVEYEVLYISASHKPYTYYCYPVDTNYNRPIGRYFSEREIKKKCKLLKELE